MKKAAARPRVWALPVARACAQASLPIRSCGYGGTRTMSTAENKALIRRYFQKIDEGDLTVIDDFVAADFVDHSTSPGISPDRDGLKQAAADFLTAVPDGYHKVEDLVAEGDRVVARIRGYGTHLGELMGVPATGKMVTATGIVIWRILDGK